MPETTEMRDRLMDAAESAIRLRGYHAVSFRDLADALGIKSSSVHYYFRHKEELGIALVARYRQRLFAALDARAQAARTGPERLAIFCDAYRDALTSADRICLCGMLGAESRGLPEDLAAAVRSFFEANILWVADTLPESLGPAERRARAAGVVAGLQGAMMLAKAAGDDSLFDQVARDLLAAQAPDATSRTPASA